jgi:hypothetical protein
MATAIRRAGVMVALALLMATALTGVAWAANVIQCSPSTDEDPICEGTERNDVMYITARTNPTAWREGARAQTPYTGAAGMMNSAAASVPIRYTAALATTILLTAITTTGLARTKTTAAPETITLSETLCPKSTSEGEGMIILATTNRPSVRTPSIVAPVMTKSLTTRG